MSSDKAVKGAFVNRTCSSVNKRSFRIKKNDPFKVQRGGTNFVKNFLVIFNNKKRSITEHCYLQGSPELYSNIITKLNYGFLRRGVQGNQNTGIDNLCQRKIKNNLKIRSISIF